MEGFKPRREGGDDRREGFKPRREGEPGVPKERRFGERRSYPNIDKPVERKTVFRERRTSPTKEY